MKNGDRGGLDLVRASMVLSGLGPLFILWAIRGIERIPDKAVWLVCGTIVVLPNAHFLFRWWVATIRNDIRTFDLGEVQTHRDHAIVYLLAMVLPLYDVNLGTRRHVIAMLVALAFVIILFFHLRLHYVTLIFALRGYSAFSWETDHGPVIVLSKRGRLKSGESITSYRLSGSVFVEK